MTRVLASRVRLAAQLLCVVTLSACNSTTFGCGPQPVEHVDAIGTAGPVQPGDVPDAKRVTISFLGDSLTAGLGLQAQEAYPALLQQMFVNEGYGEVETLNAGISADTTAGGLRRVDQIFDPTTKIVVVALGANDALRGLTVQQTHDNLAAILDAILEKRIGVVLVGMEAPTNYGEDYRASFRNVFPQLWREYQQTVTFIPFLLEGVAGDPALNQTDGMHPNQAGAKVIAEHLYPKLRDLVDQIPATR